MLQILLAVTTVVIGLILSATPAIMEPLDAKGKNAKKQGRKSHRVRKLPLFLAILLVAIAAIEATIDRLSAASQERERIARDETAQERREQTLVLDAIDDLYNGSMMIGGKCDTIVMGAMSYAECMRTNDPSDRGVDAVRGVFDDAIEQLLSVDWGSLVAKTEARVGTIDGVDAIKVALAEREQGLRSARENLGEDNPDLVRIANSFSRADKEIQVAMQDFTDRARAQVRMRILKLGQGG